MFVFVLWLVAVYLGKGCKLILFLWKHELKAHLFGSAKGYSLCVHFRICILGVGINLGCWDHVFIVLDLDNQSLHDANVNESGP